MVAYPRSTRANILLRKGWKFKVAACRSLLHWGLLLFHSSAPPLLIPLQLMFPKNISGIFSLLKLKSPHSDRRLGGDLWLTFSLSSGVRLCSQMFQEAFGDGRRPLLSFCCSNPERVCVSLTYSTVLSQNTLYMLCTCVTCKLQSTLWKLQDKTPSFALCVSLQRAGWRRRCSALSPTFCSTRERSSWRKTPITTERSWDMMLSHER